MQYKSELYLTHSIVRPRTTSTIRSSNASGTAVATEALSNGNPPYSATFGKYTSALWRIHVQCRAARRLLIVRTIWFSTHETSTILTKEAIGVIRGFLFALYLKVISRMCLFVYIFTLFLSAFLFLIRRDARVSKNLVHVNIANIFK